MPEAISSLLIDEMKDCRIVKFVDLLIAWVIDVLYMDVALHVENVKDLKTVCLFMWQLLDWCFYLNRGFYHVLQSEISEGCSDL